MNPDTKQYFILYCDMEVALHWIETNGLKDSQCIGLGASSDDLKSHENLENLRRILRDSTRVIMPDFHKNPGAKLFLSKIIELLLLESKPVTPLVDYYAKHFGKEDANDVVVDIVSRINPTFITK